MYVSQIEINKYTFNCLVNQGGVQAWATQCQSIVQSGILLHSSPRNWAEAGLELTPVALAQVRHCPVSLTRRPGLSPVCLALPYTRRCSKKIKGMSTHSPRTIHAPHSICAESRSSQQLTVLGCCLLTKSEIKSNSFCPKKSSGSSCTRSRPSSMTNEVSTSSSIISASMPFSASAGPAMCCMLASCAGFMRY